jgi:hypothetical protein
MLWFRVGAVFIAVSVAVSPASAARAKPKKTSAAPPPPAVAGPSGDELGQKGKASYDDYEFDKAAAYFADALKAGVKDKAALEQVYLYYGFSLFGLDKKAEATEQLRALFKLNAAFRLDQKGLHPDLVKFFDKERATFDKEQQAERDVLEASKPKVVAPPPPEQPKEKAQPKEIVTAPVTSSPAVNETREVPAYRSAHPGLKILPLGIGQFANGDPVGGSLFLVGTLALVGAHIPFAYLDEQNRAIAKTQYNNNPPAALAQQTYLYFGLRTAFAAAAIVVGAFGVLDAFVWSPARGEARYKQRLAIVPTPLPNGGGIASSFHW